MPTLRAAFSANATTDEWGTRGKRICICFERGEAEKAAKGQGWYGGMGAVDPEVVLADGPLFYLLKEPGPVQVLDKWVNPDEKQRKRDEALAKLTDEEIQLLGIR